MLICILILLKRNTTLFTPSTQTGSLETGIVTTGIDLTNCVSYFDGCNHCSVKDGKADACTMMYCETPSEPKCLQYATGTESGWATFSIAATGWEVNSQLPQGWGMTFQYPQWYTVTTGDLMLVIGTTDSSYRFDVGICDGETGTFEKVVIHGKDFFKVTDASFTGVKYIYYPILADTHSCISFQAKDSNEPHYLDVFEKILHSITFN